MPRAAAIDEVPQWEPVQAITRRLKSAMEQIQLRMVSTMANGKYQDTLIHSEGLENDPVENIVKEFANLGQFVDFHQRSHGFIMVPLPRFIGFSVPITEAQTVK